MPWLPKKRYQGIESLSNGYFLHIRFDIGSEVVDRIQRPKRDIPAPWSILKQWYKVSECVKRVAHRLCSCIESVASSLRAPIRSAACMPFSLIRMTLGCPVPAQDTPNSPVVSVAISRLLHYPSHCIIGMEASINRFFFYTLRGSIDIGLIMVEKVPVACAAW